jgi:glucokinase
MEVAIGIDLGGTNIKGILLRHDGEVLHQHLIPTNDDGNGKWKENVFEMVTYLKDVSDIRVSVIGLSCPGLANGQNKSIEYLPNR